MLHLGGGVGAKTDSLFYFKSGFSDRRHEASVWRWVVLPGIYKELCDRRMHWYRKNDANAASAGYFPAYRSANDDEIDRMLTARPASSIQFEQAAANS